MSSTSMRRRRRRISTRYYTNPRTERLKRIGLIVLLVVMGVIAGVLVWAAMFADKAIS